MSIDVRDVGKIYTSRAGEPVVALDDVSTVIGDGEFVSLVGPSGCGKSTLLDIIGGLIPVTSGQVLVNGVNAAERRKGTGMVFQKPVMLPWRTVLENTYLPAEVGKPSASRSGSGTALRERAEELLALVGLDAFLEKYPWELSGGMQSRVAIARALLLETNVLCMDEPFAALDEFTREQMHLELLDVWSKQRFTAVFVTHNIFEAVFLSDRVLVMTPRPGKIVAEVAIDLPRPRRRQLLGSAEFAGSVSSVRDVMEQYWDESADTTVAKGA